MDGFDFELFIQKLLMKYGFDARLTRGEDNGVDIIATIMEGERKIKYYIQCKFYNSTIGKRAVQEIFSGKHYFGNDGYPVVITNNYMSNKANKFAKGLEVEVITGFQLKEIIELEKAKEVNECNHKGLMGMIFKRAKEKVNHSSVKESVSDEESNENASPEDVSPEDVTMSMIEQYRMLSQELLEFQAKSAMRQRQIVDLQIELFKKFNCL